MSTRCHLSYFRFCLCLLVVAMLSGCASRKAVTTVEDQSYVPGPTPQAQAPASVQPAPVQVEKPVPVPLVEEARVAEQPIAPAPPSQQPVPQARPIPELSDIFFDFDRFVIRDDARSGLEANAGLLKSLSGVKILIEGHRDERGTSAYNLVLGERRAQAATQYLRDLGVSSSQMQITSYGKERPFCSEHSEACWQSNRRAHFTR
jgi:peptidoglycan-associated lipoprotein